MKIQFQIKLHVIMLIKVKLFKILSLSGQVKAIKINTEWKIASESIGSFVSRMLPS